MDNDDFEGGKFHNMHLTRGPTQAIRQGTFNAVVRLTRPEYRPSYMRILGQFSPGYLRAEIPYDAFPRVSADQDVLMVELLAHQSRPSGVN